MVILIRTIDEEQVVGLQRIEEIEVTESDLINTEDVETVDTVIDEVVDHTPPSE